MTEVVQTWSEKKTYLSVTLLKAIQCIVLGSVASLSRAVPCRCLFATVLDTHSKSSCPREFRNTPRITGSVDLTIP